jgi:cysteinyl-tRNA synthetase
LTAETTTGVKSTANESAILSIEIKKHIASFNEAIADDFSMPRAAASLFDVVEAAESELRRFSDQLMENEHRLVDDHIDIAGIKYARDALDQMDQVFGIFN